MAIAVHQYCRATWNPASSTIFDQLRRSALSVPLNIAEGVAFGPGPRCRFHLKVAYASAVETTEVIDFLMEIDQEARTSLSQVRRQSRDMEALIYRLWQKSRK